MKAQQIRQGDVLLVPVAKLPDGCTEVPHDKGRIVLAYGEVTGHAHAIADHLASEAELDELDQDLYDRDEYEPDERAKEIAKAAIARARLLVAPNGERFLEVKETVNLTHEEHSPHALLPGIYHLPTQVEYTPAELRRVAD